MPTHSSILVWRIPGMAEPGGLLSLGSHRVRHDWRNLAVAAASLDREGWCADHGVTKSQTQLGNWTTNAWGKIAWYDFSFLKCTEACFVACVSLLVSYLDDLFIDESGSLNFPAIIVLLWISPFRICLICWDAPMLGAHILTSFCVFFLDWFYHYVMSLLVSCNMIYFKVYCVWCEYYYFSFLLISISMEFFFPSPHFQAVCALHLK